MYEQDELAIQLTKANARLVKAALVAQFAETIEEAAKLLLSSKFVIMGGTEPGHSTDAVAALLAEELSAKRFVNLSAVKGIYTQDPAKFKNAKLIKKMTHAELVTMAAKYDERKPRENFIIDLLAAKILARSKIETHFTDGRNLTDVKNAILGKKHIGTVIV
jgi:uridylate kinase